MKNFFKKLFSWDIGTLLKAKLEMIGGAIVAGAGTLVAFNFLPYLTGTVDSKILWILGAYAFLTGFVGYFVRKANDPTLV